MGFTLNKTCTTNQWNAYYLPRPSNPNKPYVVAFTPPSKVTALGSTVAYPVKPERNFEHYEFATMDVAQTCADRFNAMDDHVLFPSDSGSVLLLGSFSFDRRAIARDVTTPASGLNATAYRLTSTTELFRLTPDGKVILSASTLKQGFLTWILHQVIKSLTGASVYWRPQARMSFLTELLFGRDFRHRGDAALLIVAWAFVMSVVGIIMSSDLKTIGIVWTWALALLSCLHVGDRVVAEFSKT